MEHTATEAPPGGHPDTMPTITIYTTQGCGYCQAALRLLERRGATGIEPIRIDLNDAAREAMIARTGRKTVPQVLVGDRHLGGFDDLVALDRAGELEPLLRPPA